MTYNIHAQTEYERWGEKRTDYRLIQHQHDESSEGQNRDLTLLGMLQGTYKFFISDLDGDNCPFEPTCSAFFVESVRTTNLFKGALMFSDRFTRDMNFFKPGLYPLTPRGRFFDPVEKYK